MKRVKRITEGFYPLGVKLAFIIAVGLAAILPAPAQGELLVLSGEVKDQQGAVIINAEVILGGENGTRQRTTSDRQGALRFERLGDGIYTLQISAGGFGTFKEPAISNA